jgi:NAD(P) transhydrogenase subunit beta
MSGFDITVRLASLFGGVCFVLGLHLMNSPATARRGNQVSAFGMFVAVVAVFAEVIHGGTMNTTRWTVLIAGALVGPPPGCTRRAR